MKHKGYVDINMPLDEVSKMFADPSVQGEYQDGFLKKELMSGEQGEEGSISRIYYQNKGRDMIIEESVVSNNLPFSFETFCHHEHMDNTMKCRFEKLDTNITRYHYEVEYTRVSWFMPRLMIMLFPGMFRKPIDKWMQQFKEFVERG